MSTRLFVFAFLLCAGPAALAAQPEPGVAYANPAGLFPVSATERGLSGGAPSTLGTGGALTSLAYTLQGDLYWGLSVPPENPGDELRFQVCSKHRGCIATRELDSATSRARAVVAYDERGHRLAYALPAGSRGRESEVRIVSLAPGAVGPPDTFVVDGPVVAMTFDGAGSLHYVLNDGGASRRCVRPGSCTRLDPEPPPPGSFRFATSGHTGITYDPQEHRVLFVAPRRVERAADGSFVDALRARIYELDASGNLGGIVATAGPGDDFTDLSFAQNGELVFVVLDLEAGRYAVRAARLGAGVERDVASGTLGPRDAFRFSIPVATRPGQIIYLNWADAVPVRIVPVPRTGDFVTLPGTTPRSLARRPFRDDVLAAARSILRRSGVAIPVVSSDVIPDPDPDTASVVYFSDAGPAGLQGKAFTGLDLCNRRAADGAAVFVQSGGVPTFGVDRATYHGMLVAHEAGHSLGLLHTLDTSDFDNAMDYEARPIESFPDAPLQRFEPPQVSGARAVRKPGTQNAFFHLRRYGQRQDAGDLSGSTQGVFDGRCPAVGGSTKFVLESCPSAPLTVLVSARDRGAAASGSIEGRFDTVAHASADRCADLVGAELDLTFVDQAALFGSSDGAVLDLSIIPEGGGPIEGLGTGTSSTFRVQRTLPDGSTELLGTLTGRLEGGASEPPPLPGDIDGDGSLDRDDQLAIAGALNACDGDARFLEAADLDDDGCVRFSDYRLWLGLRN